MKKQEMRKLVLKAQSGDPVAAEELCRIYSQTILFHIYSALHNQNDAEDVAQEVVIKMLNNLKDLRSPYAFSSWLQRLIVNECHKHNASRAAKKEVVREDDNEWELEDTDLANNPEHVVDQKNQRDRLYHHIRKLPEAQQAALIMYYYDELSYKEIAQALEIGTGTVARNISNAKRKLEIMLQDDENITSAARIPAAPVVLSAATITDTLKYQADKIVQPADVQTLMSVATSHIGTTYAVAAATAKMATAGTIITGKVAALAVAGTLVVGGAVGGGIYAYQVVNPAQTSTITVEKNYTPQATVEFDGAEVSNVNPKSGFLNITDNQGQALDWIITDSQNAVVATGTGSAIEGENNNPLLSLAPGEYNIEWTVQNPQGITAPVDRDFSIK